MITIGRLAAYAGVTVKAVRVYHAKGLLDEPERDAAGYRRYTADDVIAVIKIKTLVQAGVPLSRIRSLQRAEPGEFDAAIRQLESDLDARVRTLQRTREQLATLRPGLGLYVDPAVADYLTRLRDLGLTERYVQLERDLWILSWTIDAAGAAAMLAERSGALGEPEVAELLVDYDRAFARPAGDRRLADLARRMADLTLRRYGAAAATAAATGDQLSDLVRRSLAASSPAWDEIDRRVRQLLLQRVRST